MPLPDPHVFVQFIPCKGTAASKMGIHADKKYASQNKAGLESVPVSNGHGRLNLGRLLVLLLGELGGKGLGGDPASRGARSRLGHHLVDLLERETLGLGHEEVRVDEGAGAETTPDEEDGRLHVALVGTSHVRGDDGNDGVPEPVGGGGQANTTRADGQREDLADDDPGAGAPGRGEEEDEDGNEGDLGVDGRDVVGEGLGRIGGIGVRLVEANRDTNDGDEELADQHAEGTIEEDGPATPLLNRVERDGGRADVDDGEDHGDEEGVADGTRGLEEGSRVVEDEVDTGPLLHHLERGTEDGLAQVGIAVPERTLEAVGPAAEPRGGGDELALELLVGDNLGELILDVLGLLGLATQTRQSIGSGLDISALNKVAGGVGQEEETGGEDDGPEELDRNGDAIGAGILATLAGVDHAGGKHDSDGNAELVAGDKGTANLAGALDDKN